VVQVIRKVKPGVLYKFLRKHGPARVKQCIWDKEFKSGEWDYIDYTENDPIYPIVEKYCKGGDILDLGCGGGNTGAELDSTKYRFYEGVDISMEAIKKASLRTEQRIRSRQNCYHLGNIESFTPTKKYAVILFRESLFYVRRSLIIPSLRRLESFIHADGVFIVRMCDRDKYRYIVEVIGSSFEVVEVRLSPGDLGIILVFR
jgi:2-polyprenyl-3-methyl-5-hydroxy-6-metoxy-1,4-benzoquinol methylase